MSSRYVSSSKFQTVQKIIKDSNYSGVISIEFEGNNQSEEEGIMLTKRLLNKAGTSI